MFRFGVLGASHFALHKMIPAMQAGGDTPVVAIASRDGAKAAEAARALGHPEDVRLATRSCSPTPTSTPSTSRCPTTCTSPGPSARPPPASTCSSRSRRAAAPPRRGACSPRATRTSVLICEAAMVRVHPRWLAARELVRKGKIGELRAFVGTFGYDLSARRDNVRYRARHGRRRAAGRRLLPGDHEPLLLRRRADRGGRARWSTTPTPASTS